MSELLRQASKIEFFCVKTDTKTSSWAEHSSTSNTSSFTLPFQSQAISPPLFLSSTGISFTVGESKERKMPNQQSLGRLLTRLLGCPIKCAYKMLACTMRLGTASSRHASSLLPTVPRTSGCLTRGPSPKALRGSASGSLVCLAEKCRDALWPVCLASGVNSLCC